MRNRLAVLAVAVTSFVVLAYTIPLALLVARRADDAAKVDAERQVQAVAAPRERGRQDAESQR